MADTPQDVQVVVDLASLTSTMASQQREIEQLKAQLQWKGPESNENERNEGIGGDDEFDSSEFANQFKLDEQTKGAEDEDDSLTDLLKDIETPCELGPAIQEKVAEGFIKTVQRPLSKENLQSLKQKLLVPSNCKTFTVPKMNQEIWNNLTASARVADLQLQQIQQSLSNGLSALAKIANEIAINSEKIPNDTKTSILKMSIEGANILGDQMQALSSRRRKEVRRHVNPEYASICNVQVVDSTFLFGDDLKETLKSSKTASSVMRASFSKTPRFSPYPSKDLNYQRSFQRIQPSRRWNHGQQRGQRGSRRMNQNRMLPFNPRQQHHPQ